MANRLYSYGYQADQQRMGGEHDIFDYKAVSDQGKDIGSIQDYVVDNNDRLRYLIVDISQWVTGKQVLIPMGAAVINERERQVVIAGLTRDQADNLPAYHGLEDITPDYERRVTEVLYPGQIETGDVDYDRHPAFQSQQSADRFRLIEERLQVDKHRELAGEATIRKNVETHMETVEVPVAEERLVVETHPVNERDAGDTGRDISEANAKIPLYKEEVEVSKRPVVAEEATIRKEREVESRQIREELKKETLDVDDPTRRRK